MCYGTSLGSWQQFGHPMVPKLHCSAMSHIAVAGAHAGGLHVWVLRLLVMACMQVYAVSLYVEAEKAAKELGVRDR